MNRIKARLKFSIQRFESFFAKLLAERVRFPAIWVGILGSALLLPALFTFAGITIESQGQAQSPIAPLPSDVNMHHMTPDQLATYVFEHQGCKSCHTMGHDNKFGFTDRGKAIGKNFEGCVSLLTSMNLIAQTQPASRTVSDKREIAHFQQFGCTTCHQIVPGKMGLTMYGKKLKTLHMACTDVEKVLSNN